MIQKVVLLITIIGLLGGTFSTATLSQPTPTTVPTNEQQPTQESQTNTIDIARSPDNPSSYTLQYTISFSERDLSFSKIAGYDIVTLNQGSTLNHLGKPALPTKTIMIALPNDMKATHISILSKEVRPIPGMYTILPAQRPIPVGTASDQNLPIHPNTAAYLSPIPYPSQTVSLGTQADLAGQSMVRVIIYPVHYLPFQKKLTLVTSITFIIEGVSGYTCGDYLSSQSSNTERNLYTQMVQNMVINPEDVQLRSSPAPQPLGVPAGDYDYVIITQSSWVSAFQSLATWKTKKGVPATIVTTTWIYDSGGYSGTDVQKIRAFVQDAYSTWGTTYVLLGGDVDTVPCNYRTFSGVDPDPVPNDAYYADFDSDWICEVNIGRASVTGPGNSTGQIGNFINKVLTYERTPPQNNYATSAAFFGFDLDSGTHAEICKINIDDTYIPAGWTMTTVYDSQTGNHRTNVLSALNAGQNIVNHADHSNSDCMGTGYVNHDLLIYSDDMDALTNGNRQTILYSMGCDPAAYDLDSISEHFVRNSNGGGIAFIGNSRYGWYNYGTYDTLSMGYDIHFFQSLFEENLYHLGAAFSDHKNDGYQDDPGDSTYKYCFTELTLLGDPELPVWTDTPATLSVTHPLTIPMAPSSFTVHVQKITGVAIQNALVCLWKGSEIYQIGLTNSNGNATFSINPLTGGYMNVTITKQNYLPAVRTVQVLNGNLPPFTPSFPIPANGSTNISLSMDIHWGGGDPNPGDIVTYDVYFGTTITPPRVANNQSTLTYDPGTMNYLTTYYWKIVAWDNYGLSTAGPLWKFTTKANAPPVFGTPIPANGSTELPLGFSWAIPISDTEGNTFSWTIQCSNGQGTSGSGATNGTKSLTLSGLGFSTTYKVWVNATDSGGSGLYTRRWYTFTTRLNQPPIFGTPIPANGSISTPIEFTWSIPISDQEGDLFSWSIQCSNGQVNTGSDALNGTKTLDISGLSYSKTYKVWVNATDVGSGLSTRRWYRFNTGDDATPPETTMDVNGTMGLNGWYVSPVQVILIATDNQSGVDRIMYQINSGGWSEYSTPILLTQSGNYTIEYYAIDNTGNEEAVKTAVLHLDLDKPEMTLLKQQISTFEVSFIAQVRDDTSGIDRVEFSLDGALQSTDTVAPYEWSYTGLGNHLVNVTVFDKAGNSKSQSMSTPVSYDYQGYSGQQQSLGLLLKQQMLH